MKASEHKSLMAKRDRIRRTLKAHAQGSREWERARADLAAVNAEISRIGTRVAKGKDGITVSEHAMLRYIERVMHVTPEELAEKVLPRPLAEKLIASGLASKRGQFEVPVGGDDGFGTPTHKVVFRDGIITTVLHLDETLLNPRDKTSAGPANSRRGDRCEQELGGDDV